MMMCVTTRNYAMVINGKVCRHIIPEWGLRQGDPISLYLFLLCAKSLSALLYKANRKGVLMGVPTSKRGPSDKPRYFFIFFIFTEDNLLFCRSTLAQWNCLTDVLRLYEEASG
jgi:hypothetical protein